MLFAPRQRRTGTSSALVGLLCCLASFAVIGFSRQAVAAAGHVAIESGGLRRTAVLVERERLKLGRRPVIMVLHGGSGSGARVRRNLGLEEAIRARNLTLVYPDAIGGHWGDTQETARRDIDFLRMLIDQLVAN